MLTIKKLWSRISIWLTKYGKYLLLVVFFVSIFGYIMWLKRQRDADKRDIRVLELRLEVYKKSAELYALESQREIIKLKQEYTKEEIKEIDKEITKVESEIGNIYREIGDLTLEEKVDEYEKLGK